MKRTQTANKLTKSLCLAMLAGTFGANAFASGMPEPLPYDLADLIMDRTLSGHVITVVEQISCMDENSCHITNPPFVQVIPVHIAHLPVADVRRLVLGCHYGRCVEEMTGLFTGTSLDVTSSEDYRPRCLPADRITGQETVDLRSRFAARCSLNTTGAAMQDSSDDLVRHIAEAAKAALDAADLQFELNRGQEGVMP